MAVRTLPIVVDFDRIYLTLKVATALCFAALAVVLAGEFLGWWNDWGQVATIVLTVIGTLLGIATWLFGATGKQVALAVSGVLQANVKLDQANLKLDQANLKLDQANLKLDQANLKLDQANTKHDVTNAKLDGIAAILRDIRDRLGPPS